jgi:SNF2 family DNA or RNA helicase
LRVKPKQLSRAPRATLTESIVEQELVKFGEEKVGPSLEWAEDTLESAKKIVVFTHLRETAETLAQKIEKATEIPTFCITGDMAPDKRLSTIDEFKALPKAAIVATMHSVGIGINGLDVATDVLFAELYYRPETVSQALGRFNRLSSKEPTTISLLVLEGTLDEALAVKLNQKISAINSAIKAGQGEENLEKALGAAESDEQFFADLIKYDHLAVDENDYLS